MADLPPLIIDLGDGAPPARIEKIERPKVSEKKPLRFAAPPKIEITSVPVGLTISVAPISCLGCGAEHRDHRGIFLESRLTNGVTALRQISLREAGPYLTLPRRVDIAPREAIPVCADCFERNIQQAVAVAQAETEIPVSFGEPGESRPVAAITEEIIQAIPDEEPVEPLALPDPEQDLTDFSIQQDQEENQ